METEAENNKESAVAELETYSGQERRARDRSRILLRRRRVEAVEPAVERRRGAANGFDIAAALEMHLGEHTTKRAMLRLLESWLQEARASAERDDNYIEAVEYATEVMQSAPDVLTGICILQRQSES
jgi:hypothetical protein